ncbi:hypothetical protein OG311_11090 [Streptomyces sp. NBC_01343]|uniref:DUF6426 family protein n=1 Tax=Streptomyces sp. NBC_01343 TaxID=2903832 RepID=UPI002E0F29FF|nr:hypothetical protein OG311_11090 [Streptomyces sp. NBC_01343]
MKLRSALAAAALGATVLTAAPAVLLPQTAFAADCNTSCDQDTIIVEGSLPPETGGGNGGMTSPVGSSGGGSGSSNGTSARLYSEGQKWEEEEFCRHNSSNLPEGINRTVSYKVSVQVNAGLSAEVKDALKATLGTELNVEESESYTVNVTIPPGDGWGLYVQYQTVVYEVTTKDWSGIHTDYVNVTRPTGRVTSRSC